MRLPVFVLTIFPILLLAQHKSNMTLSAVGLPDGSAMPRQFTCDGKNISPPLTWSGEPEGTQSFALIVDDRATRIFTHWLLWDIPAPVHSLEEGAKPEGISGTNDFLERGYSGPCPPAGGPPHRYFFQLLALDVPSLNVKAGKRRDALDDALRKHVLAKVEYHLQYGH